MIASHALADRTAGPVAPACAEEVVAKYWVQAYRFAAMVSPSDGESQDVAQEALLRVIHTLHRFDPSRGTFDAWLWRIVLNAARDAGRASLRRAGLFDRLRHQHSTAPVAGIEDLAIQHADDAVLLRAVRSLKRRPRTVVALRFGAQLTYAEIAAQLGISEAAALMATRRALATLRTTMKESRDA